MTVGKHLTEFGGLPVGEWTPGKPPPVNPAGSAVRISVEWEEGEENTDAWKDKFEAFLALPAAAQLAGLVVGPWPEMQESNNMLIVETIVEHAAHLPNLNTLFLGDVICEECEISWIQQSDMTPLLKSYGGLHHFGCRGGEWLNIGPVAHVQLKTLVVQTGGLNREVVQHILQSELPELEHLELWIGDEGYGCSVAIDDLLPLFSGELFPKLRHLGLMNSQFEDEIAAAVAGSPLLERLEVLDLSMGTLGNAGAEALIASPTIASLKHLNIRHHYVSNDVLMRLQSLGPMVNIADPQVEDHKYRYVEVSE